MPITIMSQLFYPKNMILNTLILMLFSSLCMVSTVEAQIDRSKGGILINAEESKEENTSTLRKPTSPSLSNTNNGFTVAPSKSSLPSENTKRTVDMTPRKSKFIDQRYDMQPKWVESKFPVDQMNAGDQYLGDVKTNAEYIELLFRDFGQVDGDRVRVYLNEEVIIPNIALSGGYYGMIIDLKPGFNKIDFQALNMGEFGPNTADLKLIDDDGTIISSKQWNLMTGNKATIIVVK